MRAMILAALMLFAAAAPAAKPPAGVDKLKPGAPRHVQKFWDACEAERPRQVAAAQERLAGLRAGLAKAKAARISPRPDTSGKTYTYLTAQVKAAEVASIQAAVNQARQHLDGLRAGDILTPPQLTLETLEVGSIGTAYGLRVQQVVDKQNMLVRLALPFEGVISDAKHPVWLHGKSTEGLADGKRVEGEMLLEVVGTKQYETPLDGPRTVYLLRPFVVADWVERGAKR